ncbi:hypothetical protein P4S83_07700 [Aneurinibacillus thermoaerophilus]|nr:hypothetical protein [Aneurinibacillus thermoaerophilus]
MFAVLTGDCGTGKTTTIRRFVDRLRLQSFTAIRQRIDIQCRLGHFDRVQVGEYVTKHLQYAGVSQQIFSVERSMKYIVFLEEPQG